MDQETGEDLNPTRSKQPVGGEVSTDMARNPDRPVGIPVVPVYADEDPKTRRKVQRITSPEKWEIKQVYSTKPFSMAYSLSADSAFEFRSQTVNIYNLLQLLPDREVGCLDKGTDDNGNCSSRRVSV